MTLIRSFENPEYRPEYSTLAVRDFLAPGGAAPRERPPSGPLSHEEQSHLPPTIARAGDGWLEALAGDDYHTVRLELHRSAPAADGACGEVVELPYRSRTGWVGLTTVIGHHGKPGLQLGEPGLYAVRVSVRRGGREGDLWRLAFWRQDPLPELRRWLARRFPASFTAESIWGDALGWAAAWVLRGVAARSPSGATLEQIAAYAGTGRSGRTWLDEPLPGEAVAAEITQLGVPAPRNRRELLAALVAAGILSVEGKGDEARYRLGQPRPLRDVLRLPPERLAALELRDQRNRYGSLAADLACVVAWASTAAVFSVRALADRLRATTEEVRATLGYAAADGLLAVTGDLEDPGAALTLALLPRREPPRPSRPQRLEDRGPEIDSPRPAVPVPPLEHGGPPRAGISLIDRRVDATVSPPTIDLPTGAPPRAGFRRPRRPDRLAAGSFRHPRAGHRPPAAPGARDGRGGRRVRPGGGGLSRPPGRADRLAGPGRRALRRARPDGAAARLRRVPPRPEHVARGHLVDLADGSRRSYRDDRDEIGGALSVAAGGVYLAGRSSVLWWVPGSAPRPAERSVRYVDPVSGAALERDQRGNLLVRAGAAVTPVSAPDDVALAPAGTRVYRFEWRPPNVTFHDLAGGAAPRTYALPAGARVNAMGPWSPVWEDVDHCSSCSTRPLAI